MKIVVVGAGVVGVTTAYALVQRGHEVTVIERLAGAAEETSRSNAGQLSYGVVYPWASAAMVKKALPWFLDPNGPLKMRLPPSLEALRFLMATLRFAYAPGVYGLNKRAMLRLGIHSRTCFLALQDRLNLAFDGKHDGLISLASTASAMTEYRQTSVLLTELGIDHKLLDSEEIREAEPGMTGHGPLHGGLQYRSDGTGDIHLFTRALADVCADAGVSFRYQTSVEGLVGDHHRIHAVDVQPPEGGTERLEADAFVMCAAVGTPPLVRKLGLHLPIYPIKGYTLTARLLDASRAPRSTVHDDRYKVVSTRLGDRLRVSGFVELADLNRTIPESRLNLIRRSAESRFPGAADLHDATAWTGFRPMTPDGPPAIGRGPRENLFINTGHGTFGWTLAAGSADLISRVIDGETPSVAMDPFRPGRFGE